MTIELWEPPVIDIPPVVCEAKDCDLPRVCDMVWHYESRGELHKFQVCGFHKFALEGRGYAAFFPLNASPPLEYILAKIEEHMRAKQRPVYQPTATFSANFSSGTFFYQHYYGGFQ